MTPKEKYSSIFKSALSIGDDKLNDQLKYNEIEEWDSLNHLNLVMALSEEFDITLEFVEVLSIEKIGDIYPLIEKRGIE